MSSVDVQRFSSMTLDDLYEELGKSIFTREFPEASLRPKLFEIQRGKAFVSGFSQKLKAKICAEWNYCSKRGDYGNIQALVYAISPLISTVIGMPEATAVIVAMILIKMGLDKFCDCPSA